jgi:hypothetical protein
MTAEETNDASIEVAMECSSIEVRRIGTKPRQARSEL